jgi:hypothetical protein
MNSLMHQTPEALRRGFDQKSVVGKEHGQLKYFEGKWTHKIKIWLDPQSPPVEGEGTSVAEAIHGGRHVLLNDQGTVGGSPYTSSTSIGFDNLREQFVTSTIDSMRTGVRVSYGTFDPDANAYTFDGEVRSLKVPGGTIKMRMVRRIVDNDHYVFEFHEMRGGKWIKTMENDFTRQ